LAMFLFSTILICFWLFFSRETIKKNIQKFSS
jgi:hypothetical protein